MIGALQRWAHFDLRAVAGREKPAKVPDRKTNEPASWMTYPQAVSTLAGHDGLAFLLGDGYAGIDIDGADLDPLRSREIIDACAGAYVEPSLSGAGIHIIGRCPLLGFEADFRKTPAQFTAWTSARFFVFLGTGSGDPSVDISEAVARFAPSSQPTRSAAKREGFLAAKDVDDDFIVLLGETSDSGDLFKSLWAGDTEAYGGDRSRADQALVNMIGYWTNYDPARIDRIFRRSGLYRDKWEVASYRNATITKAATK